jgi:hypothetical protein
MNSSFCALARSSSALAITCSSLNQNSDLPCKMNQRFCRLLSNQPAMYTSLASGALI